MKSQQERIVWFRRAHYWTYAVRTVCLYADTVDSAWRWGSGTRIYEFILMNISLSPAEPAILGADFFDSNVEAICPKLKSVYLYEGKTVPIMPHPSKQAAWHLSLLYEL